jgi:hypothetical protein
MSTELSGLAQWLEVTQSVVAIIRLPILTLTLLMIGRQAQYAHHTTMSQVYQNTADGFATVQSCGSAIAMTHSRDSRRRTTPRLG